MIKNDDILVHKNSMIKWKEIKNNHRNIWHQKNFQKC